MARKITDACVSCGTCVNICPVKAIVDGDSHYEIEADKCSATYLITDSYNQEYWTPAVPQD